MSYTGPSTNRVAGRPKRVGVLVQFFDRELSSLNISSPASFSDVSLPSDIHTTFRNALKREVLSNL